MQKEISTLQAELSSLRNQLATAGGEKGGVSATKSAVKTEIEKEYPSKVVVDSGMDEDGRIIDLLKELDDENRMKKKEELEKMREEEAKFVAAEKAKAESTKQTKPRGEQLEKKHEEEAKFVAAEKAKTMTKGAEVVKAKTGGKKATSKKAAKKASTERKTATKSVAKKASVTAVADASDDWSSLADSTLKRKTVAELSKYLTGKVSSTVLPNKYGSLHDILFDLGYVLLSQHRCNTNVKRVFRFPTALGSH